MHKNLKQNTCSMSWSCGDLTDRNIYERLQSTHGDNEDYFQQQLNRKNSTIDLFRSLDR